MKIQDSDLMDQCGAVTARGHNQSTFSGRPFWAADPRPEDIRLDDIAAQLACICRYGGSVGPFRWYCVHPEHRILTANFDWVPANEIKTNDILIGFDEKIAAGEVRRKIRTSAVLANGPTKRSSVKMRLSDGNSLICSLEHPWFVESAMSKNKHWKTAAEISEALSCGHRWILPRFSSVWHRNESRQAGWLAGMFDGEGSFSFANRRGTQVSISQKPGLVQNEIESTLRGFGYDFSNNLAKTGVHNVQLRGGWPEHMRLLGEIRPMRLLNTAKNSLLSGDCAPQLCNRQRNIVTVEAVESIGDVWLSGLTTSTGTYFCEGYGSHNSVAQHSVLVSLHVPAAFALEGLLHDAHEAYLGDMIRPIQELHINRKEIESRVDAVIRSKYGLPAQMSPQVKLADYQALETERRDLLPPPKGVDWGTPVAEPWTEKIEPLLPIGAYNLFIERVEELMRLYRHE